MPPAISVLVPLVLDRVRLVKPITCATALLLLVALVSLMPLGMVSMAVLVTPRVRALAMACTITVQVALAGNEVTVPETKFPARVAVQPAAPPVLTAETVVTVENAPGTESMKVMVLADMDGPGLATVV